MDTAKIKQNLNRIVSLPDGTKGKLTGVMLRRRADGEFYYQAELQDLTAQHSIRICKLEEITEVEDNPA